MQCECDLVTVGHTATGRLCALHARLIEQGVDASRQSSVTKAPTGDVDLVRDLRKQARRFESARYYRDVGASLLLAADEIERLNAMIR